MCAALSGGQKPKNRASALLDRVPEDTEGGDQEGELGELVVSWLVAALAVSVS